MIGNYSIGLLQKSDVRSFIQIIRKSFIPDYLILSIYRARGIENFISSEIDNYFSPYRYFVVSENKRIVGCAEFKIIRDKNSFFLNIIAVDNEFKGRGIGKVLLNYGIAYFLKRGFTKIQLDVYQDNKVALRLYNSLGYKRLHIMSLYKFLLGSSDIEHNNFFLLNFPQYKDLKRRFGFSYLDLMIDENSIRLGVIENDLIFKGEYNLFQVMTAYFLFKKMNFKTLYLICEHDCTGKPDLIFINTIYRMELNV